MAIGLDTGNDDSTPGTGDIIDQMLGMDDSTLSKKLGFSDKVADFKKDLAAAQKLTGDARDTIVEDLEKMFVPRDYDISDLGYKLKRAQSKDKKGGAMTDNMLANCGCVDPYDD